MLKLETKDGAVYLPVKVVPGASRTRCLGAIDGRLKIAVSAAPEKGKANIALTAFLAKRLGLRRRDVRVERGHTSAIKIIRLDNTTATQVRETVADQ